MQCPDLDRCEVRVPGIAESGWISRHLMKAPRIFSADPHFVLVPAVQWRSRGRSSVEHDVQIVVSAARGELVEDGEQIPEARLAAEVVKVGADRRANSEALVLLQFINRRVEERKKPMSPALDFFGRRQSTIPGEVDLCPSELEEPLKSLRSQVQGDDPSVKPAVVRLDDSEALIEEKHGGLRLLDERNQPLRRERLVGGHPSHGSDDPTSPAIAAPPTSTLPSPCTDH